MDSIVVEPFKDVIKELQLEVQQSEKLADLQACSLADNAVRGR